VGTPNCEILTLGRYLLIYLMNKSLGQDPHIFTETVPMPNRVLISAPAKSAEDDGEEDDVGRWSSDISGMVGPH